MEARLTLSFSASVFCYEVKIGDDACRDRRPTLLPCARSSPASETFAATLCVELPGAGNSQGYERLKPGRNCNEIHAITVMMAYSLSSASLSHAGDPCTGVTRLNSVTCDRLLNRRNCSDSAEAAIH